MTHDTLITADALAALYASGRPLLVADCSFELTDLQAGRRTYDAGHLPGARHVHLEHDLSGPKTGRNGRHPLPEREAFAARMAALGLTDDTQVVAYDQAGGMYAARLWWMLRWAGHRAVAVLDGGTAAWRAAGQPLVAELPPAPVPGRFTLRPSLVTRLHYDDVLANVERPTRLVIDARAPIAFAARTRRWTRWAATSPARATGCSATTWRPTAASSPRPSCARPSMR